MTTATSLTLSDATALVLQWDKLQWQIACKWWAKTGRVLDLDDLHSCIRLGFWEAALRFDPSRGFAFPTLAGRWCLKYLTPYIQRELHRGIHVPNHEHNPQQVTVEPLTEFYAVQSRPQPDPAAFERMTEGLDDRERFVLTRRHADGQAYSAIGAELRVGKERARAIHDAAVLKLRGGLTTRRE